tara:strand:+ start:428 stop:1624 length:1197 start_codon:yes stop_codon:yes gene_type:complete
MNFINIFNPTQTTPDLINNVQSLAMLLSNGDQRKAHDYVLLYSAFGHHFGYDMGRTITQGYVLKGKPTLNADAMAGICRRSGLCRFIRVLEWTHEACTIEMARTDEPPEITHIYTFNMQMAQQQGLTRQQNWSRMPMQMLRARALTMGLRATFPDCVSGIYSVDEIADNTSMNDQERSMIIAQSMGEDINLSSRPQTQRPPQPSRQPQPQRAPQPTPAPQPEISVEDQSIQVKPFSDDVPPETHRAKVTPLNAFESVSDMLNGAIKFNKLSVDEVNAACLRHNAHIDQMSEQERRDFFYKWLLCSALRNSDMIDDEWWRNTSMHKKTFASIKAEFPALAEIRDADIGKNLGRRDFWECAKVSAHFTGANLERAKASLKKLVNNPDFTSSSEASYLASL